MLGILCYVYAKLNVENDYLMVIYHVLYKKVRKLPKGSSSEDFRHLMQSRPKGENSYLGSLWDGFRFKLLSYTQVLSKEQLLSHYPL